MPPRNTADSIRERIVDAATTEFSSHGIAGARVDRIAKLAKTSKERVYAHFRSKEELYEFVAARELDALAAATHLDAADLPGYAGRVHDYFSTHPDSFRIMRWGQLELAGMGSSEAVRRTLKRKVDALRLAQQDGLIDSSWDPLDVLIFVHQLATAWSGQAGVDLPEPARYEEFLVERRAAIVAAVEKLFPR